MSRAAACALAVFWSATLAQQDISGTWAGDLLVAPDTELAVHFVLARAGDGSYSAVLTSPDPDGVQDVAVREVTFESDRLTLAVDALSGAYEGTLADGVITGEWRQEGTSIPLTLAPYEAPALSQEAIDRLTGQWVGQLESPAGALAIVYRFETGDDGELVGFLDSPDQGATGIAMANIEFVDGELSLRVPQVRGEYTATIDETGMTGTWSQGANPIPLNMTRGEYTPTVTTLDLSAEAMAELAGAWSGTLGPLELTVRLETNANEEPVGYLDVPAQGASGVPITEASFADGRLTLGIASIGAQYTAEVSGDEMSGEWTQGPQTNPLTLTRQAPE